MSSPEMPVIQPGLPSGIRLEFYGRQGIISSLEQALSALNQAHRHLAQVFEYARAGDDDAEAILGEYTRLTGELTMKLAAPEED